MSFEAVLGTVQFQRNKGRKMNAAHLFHGVGKMESAESSALMSGFSQNGLGAFLSNDKVSQFYGSGCRRSWTTGSEIL